MSRYPAGKFYLWYGQPVNVPHVTPPLSLRAFLVVCILSVTGTLFYGVATELGGGPRYSPLEMTGIAIVYFVLPVLAAHTISTNHAVSRTLISVFLVALTTRALSILESASIGDDARAILMLVGFVVAGLLVWWLFFSMKIRVYYALITGADIPIGLDRPVEEVLGASPMERRFGRFAKKVAPYTEKILIVLVIVTVILAWASMTYEIL